MAGAPSSPAPTGWATTSCSTTSTGSAKPAAKLLPGVSAAPVTPSSYRRIKLRKVWGDDPSLRQCGPGTTTFTPIGWSLGPGRFHLHDPGHRGSLDRPAIRRDQRVAGCCVLPGPCRTGHLSAGNGGSGDPG